MRLTRWARSHVSRDPAALQDRMLVRLAQHAPADPWRLPWSADPHSLTLLLAALIGRTDDYTGPMPARYLPAEPARLLIDDLARAARPLDVCEQLAIALRAADGHLLAAALQLHLAARVLARGADARLDARLALWLDERLDLGAALAPFDPALSPSGDPLGDNRHYWAAFCAGLASVWAKRHGRRGAGRLLHATVFLGVPAATVLHSRLDGPDLSHTTVSRMGLRHGISLGVAAARQAAVRRHSPTQVYSPPSEELSHAADPAVLR